MSQKLPETITKGVVVTREALGNLIHYCKRQQVLQVATGEALARLGRSFSGSQPGFGSMLI